VRFVANRKFWTTAFCHLSQVARVRSVTPWRRSRTEPRAVRVARTARLAASRRSVPLPRVPTCRAHPLVGSR
jgi:hypothetical protein